MTRKEIITYYYNLGFSIIPIVKEGKKPLTDWAKYQSQRMTSEALLKYGDCNIAVVTGKLSGIDVLDLDEYKAAFPQSKIELNTPLIATTPRGGRHGYFKHKQGNRSFANEAIALDMKSEGGYVLLAPSKIGGNSYKFNKRPSKEILESLPEIPEEVLKAIIPANSQMAGERFDISTAIGSSEGGRNGIMMKAILSILNKHEEKEWDSQAWEEVVALNSTFKPPMTDREMQSLFIYEKSYCRRNPSIKKHDSAVLSENKVYTTTTIQQDNENVIQQILEGKTKGYSTGYPPLDEVTGGLIPGDSYLFFGDTNVGKSVFTASILLNIAKAYNLGCLYFDLENAYLKTVSRLTLLNEDYLTKEEWRYLVDNDQGVQLSKYIRKLNDIPVKTWDLVKLQNRFSAITYDAVEKCMLEGVEEGRKVIVIDHLHYFEPSDKDHNEVGDIAKKINDFAGVHNVVIVMVAHTKKGLKQVKKDQVEVRRPIVDDINGSSFIAKHTKNIIGIMRNDVAVSDIDKQETWFFVDKTKTGETGCFKLKFNPHNLHFSEENYILPKQNLYTPPIANTLLKLEKEVEISDEVIESEVEAL